MRPYLAARFPLLDPNPVLSETCLYTNTPDENFIIDFVPGAPNVVIGAGAVSAGMRCAVLCCAILCCHAIV